MKPSCDTCLHWQMIYAHRGNCLRSGHVSTTYRLIGSSGPTTVYEQTKPDHWCTEYSPPETRHEDHDPD